MNAMARALAELFGRAGVNVLPGPWAPLETWIAVQGVHLDSRQIRFGDLFLALPGQARDGRQFIESAVQRGAVAICVDGAVTSADLRAAAGVPIFGIAELTTMAGSLAAAYYDAPSHAMQVLGVTGTNGKTSVTHHLAQLLEALGERSGICGTLGNGFLQQLRQTGMTTQDAVGLQRTLAWMRDAGARWAAIEVSSHALDQERVGGVQFAGALFTNLSRDHLDYHGTMEAYGESKRQLFLTPGLDVAAINRDDAFGRSLLDRVPAPVDVLDFSLQDRSAQVCVTASEPQADGSTCLRLQSPWGAGDCRTLLLGDFAQSNLVGALTLLAGLGADWQKLLAAASQVQAVPGRMQTFPHPQGFSLVVDYAHSPDALERVLLVLRGQTRGRLICVFGCGGERDPGKRPLMGEVASSHADLLVLTDDNPRREDGDRIIAEVQAGIAAGAGKVQVERDRAAATRWAVAHAAPGDLVLIAGKGHEDYQDGAAGRRHYSDIEMATLLTQAERQHGGASTTACSATGPGAG